MVSVPIRICSISQPMAALVSVKVGYHNKSSCARCPAACKRNCTSCTLHSSKTRPAKCTNACNSEKLSTFSHNDVSTVSRVTFKVRVASIRRMAASSKSSPSISSSGQRERKLWADEVCNSSIRLPSPMISSRIMLKNLSRIGGSISGYSSTSTAACALAKAARLPSVKVYSTRSFSESSSKSRVMLSSIKTKPLNWLEGLASFSWLGAMICAARTGAICTRNNCPACVLVTNCAKGAEAPRCKRC